MLLALLSVAVVCGCGLGWCCKTCVEKIRGFAVAASVGNEVEESAECSDGKNEQIMVCIGASNKYHMSAECSYVRRSTTMKRLTLCSRCRDIQNKKGE